jgi:hypothetical protein
VRVYIEHRNRPALILFWLERYDVTVRVVFTEEEEAIIRTYDLYCGIRCNADTDSGGRRTAIR